MLNIKFFEIFFIKKKQVLKRMNKHIGLLLHYNLFSGVKIVCDVKYFLYVTEMTVNENENINILCAFFDYFWLYLIYYLILIWKNYHIKC